MMSPGSMSSTTRLRVEFDETLVSCVISSVTDVLGAFGGHALVYHIPMDTIKTDPEMFHEKLKTLLGTGASTIEYLVAKELYRRMGFMFSEDEDFDFVRCVAKAKEMAMEKSPSAETGVERNAKRMARV